MTKITVFGNEESREEKKKIEFVYWLDPEEGPDGDFDVSPSDYDNLCLLGRDDYNKYDLIMAWDINNARTIYLGHWNDGVV